MGDIEDRLAHCHAHLMNRLSSDSPQWALKHIPIGASWTVILELAWSHVLFGDPASAFPRLALVPGLAGAFGSGVGDAEIGLEHGAVGFERGAWAFVDDAAAFENDGAVGDAEDLLGV